MRQMGDMAMEPESNQASPTGDDLEARIQAVLALMRPAIQEDEGDIEFIEVTPEGVVRIRFLGACVGCPSSTHTLHNGIERLLKERVPEVSGVEATTDR